MTWRFDGNGMTSGGTKQLSLRVNYVSVKIKWQELTESGFCSTRQRCVPLEKEREKKKNDNKLTLRTKNIVENVSAFGCLTEEVQYFQRSIEAHFVQFIHGVQKNQ